MNIRTQEKILKATTVFIIAPSALLCIYAAIDLTIRLNKEPPSLQESQKMLAAATRERFHDERLASGIGGDQKSTDEILDELLKPEDGPGMAKSGCVYR